MALEVQKIKILIFDMDDTLFDTYGQLVRPATLEACEAMVKAGLNTSVDECFKARQELATSRPRTSVYNELVRHFSVREGTNPESVADAGFKAFHDREIKENISAFKDTHTTLETLSAIYALYLVTLGSPKTQQRKVKLLKLEKFFKHVFYVDVVREKNKSETFRKILEMNSGITPQAFVSIGNRIDSDIKDAKELKMQAVLMEHGEYLHLKPINPAEEPDARINKISELVTLLSRPNTEQEAPGR